MAVVFVNAKIAGCKLRKRVENDNFKGDYDRKVSSPEKVAARGLAKPFRVP
jgi:hypothetical protein